MTVLIDAIFIYFCFAAAKVQIIIVLRSILRNFIIFFAISQQTIHATHQKFDYTAHFKTEQDGRKLSYGNA